VKDEFLATISHELRTPLNAILGWAQLLSRANGDWSIVEEAAGVIDRNARVQAELIEDLLDMSRIISGKMRLNFQPVNAANVVTAAIASVQPAAVTRKIRLQSRVDGPVPSINGDPGRLQQIMWNLLSNAVKFTPQGGQVLVTLEPVDSQVEIRVTDNGPGLDPAFIPYLFERFRQADGSTTRKFGGLGLGLAIVKHLVELHGGTIYAENVSRETGSTGAIFIVRLPVTSHTAGHDAVTPGKTPSAVCEAVDLTGLKVLVVDDDPDARRLLKRLLVECHAEVTTAASGREALQLLAAVHPDILVSDIGMPEMDGYELITRIRAAGGGTLPAAAVTAFARSEDKRRALDAGYQSHIAKPIEPALLLATVAGLAGRPSNGHAMQNNGKR
jgi:CheY-like chemotaxis protein